MGLGYNIFLVLEYGIGYFKGLRNLKKKYLVVMSDIVYAFDSACEKRIFHFGKSVYVHYSV